MTEQECPLCGLHSEFKAVSSPSGKIFTCCECSEFFIDAGSESYLLEVPEFSRTEFRNKLSTLAKSGGEGRLLVLREPRIDEIHGNGRGVAMERMIVEWKGKGK